MDSSLVIWKGDWSEIPDGCEIGPLDGVSLGNFQLDPNSGMWKEFWSEISGGP